MDMRDFFTKNVWVKIFDSKGDSDVRYLNTDELYKFKDFIEAIQWICRKEDCVYEVRNYNPNENQVEFVLYDENKANDNFIGSITVQFILGYSTSVISALNSFNVK
jgi:hypothetical protein